ncbi:thiamine ABC transporter substrate-binding protein [Gulosibacter chungangensis]|uniref:Thiamine ABC transporter substrate-binding protein n=1 Tax=Gulosibacter chungangensis TaxID=979746 RepID=A0A7J5BAC8_9MICO|nr:thiamine ABC transporter substrate-binding protein [Gulosibacter chungangensis]KAB1642729.1 thiamine ABC transporter substrate-binding protein [Gulosibacter chungangensis]
MKRRITMTATIAAAALTMTGCSAVDQVDSTGSTESAGGTVTILTHDSFVITDEQIAAFEEQSGYTLQTTAPGDAGVITNQLILSGDAPTVDGVYGIENYSTQTLLDAGVLASYTSPNLPESATDLAIEGTFTPIDQGQVCVNIDHAWFEENGVAEPTTLDDLTKPEYASLLVTMNPATSSPGLAFLVATVTEQGDDWQSYWQSLLEGGTKVVSGWSDAYFVDFSGAEGQGDYPLVLSYSSSPAEADGQTGVLEASCTPQVEYAAVVEGAANPEGAQAFIDFLLGEDFQSGVAENMYMYPVDSEIALPETWAQHATLVENPIQPDLAQVAQNRDTWIADWTELFENHSN